MTHRLRGAPPGGRHRRWAERRDATARLRAVAALPDDPSSCPALLEATRDPAPEVARAALRRLRSLGGPEHFDVVRNGMLVCDLALVTDYARVLRERADPHAVDAAIRALGAEPYTRALAGALALGELGDPRAAAPLRGALGHPVAGVRRAALDALRRLGRDDATAAACARLLVDKHAAVRRAAVHATGRTAKHPGALLGPALLDPDPLVRRALAAYTATLPSRDAAALLEDADRHVRHAAAAGSGRAQAAVLVEVLRADGYWEVRAQAARTLGALGDRDTADPLGRALADAHAIVRVAALRALRVLLAERDLLAALDRQLEDPDPALRSATLYALGRLTTTALDRHVTALVGDSAPDVRLALVHTAEVACRDPGALLRTLSHDGDATVRHAALLRLEATATR